MGRRKGRTTCQFSDLRIDQPYFSWGVARCRKTSPARQRKPYRTGLSEKLVTVEEEKDNILKHMKRANRSILQEKNIKRSNNIINTNLNDIYGARLAQQVNLGFVPPDFGDVVDLLQPLLHPSRDSKVLAVFYSR